MRKKNIAIVSGKKRASGGIESIIELLSAGNEYQFHRFFYDKDSWNSIETIGSENSKRTVHLHAIKQAELKSEKHEENREEIIKNAMAEDIINLKKSVGKVVQEYGLDLIHIHSPNMIPAGFLAKTAKQNNIPVISTFHYAKVRQSETKKIAIANTFQYSDKIICVSNAAKEVLVEEFGHEDKIEVIYNGIILGRFSLQPRTYDSSKPMRMLYPAPICKEKGHLDLLEIMEKVHEKTDNFCVTLRGNHSNNPIHTAIFKKRRTEINLTDHFRIRNPIDYSKMPDEYESHDILLFPSQEEGLGLISLEGQASGLPVLSSDVGGIVETLEPDITALISPYASKKENPESFKKYIEIYAENILKVMQSPSLYRRLSENAVDFMKKSEQFSQETMIERHRILYDSLL